MALRADALDDLLAQIAAFGEADCVHLLRLLRQRFLVDVLAVPRLSVFDADNAGVVHRRGLRACGLHFRNDCIGFGRGAVDARARLAGLRNTRDGVLAPSGKRVIVWNRGSDLSQDRRGAGAFDANAGGGAGDIFEFDLIGDDVALDVLEDLLAELRFGIDEEMIGETEEVEIGLDASLRAQQKGIASGAGRHFLDFVAGEIVQEACAVAATREDAATGREV